MRKKLKKTLFFRTKTVTLDAQTQNVMDEFVHHQYFLLGSIEYKRQFSQTISETNSEKLNLTVT